MSLSPNTPEALAVRSRLGLHRWLVPAALVILLVAAVIDITLAQTYVGAAFRLVAVVLLVVMMRAAHRSGIPSATDSSALVWLAVSFAMLETSCANSWPGAPWLMALEALSIVLMVAGVVVWWKNRGL